MDLDQREHVDTYGQLSSAKAFEFAEENGLVVDVRPLDELQIDLDTPEAIAKHEQLWQIAVERMGWTPKQRFITPSRSGDGVHVRVELRGHPMEQREAFMLQAMLGSDPVRELLSFVQHQEGDPNAILLFEKPETMAAISAWRQVAK